MGKLGTTLSVFGLTLTGGLTCGALSGCNSDAWLIRDHEKTVEPTPVPPELSPIDAGISMSPPARLQALIVKPTPPPAISGGTLTVSTDGSLAVAADSDRDLIYLIDTADQSVQTITLTQGSEPGRVVLDGSGGAHVNLRKKGSVVRVDLKTATVVSESAVCQLPRGLAFDATHNELAVACASGELVTVDAVTHVEHSRVFIDLDLRDVVIGKDGQKFVSRYRSAELLKLGADGKCTASTPPGTVSTRFENLFGSKDSASLTQLPGPIPTPAISRQVHASATLAWRTISAADGTTVMLHQQSQDDEVVISQAGGYGGGPGNCQPITQGGVTRYDAAGKPSSPILLGGAALVVDIAASSDGRWLALAKPGAYLRGENGSLEVISTALSSANSDVDAGVGIVAPGKFDAGVPSLPPGLRVAEDGGFDFTGPSSIPPNPCNVGAPQGFDVQTTAVAFDLEGTLYAFSREPAQLAIYRVGGSELEIFPSLELDQTIALSSVSMRDTGHELFHGDVGTGLACASCHGEALDDGHVWNFRDFGPRRTQNIRGGLLSTLPLHWEGDLSTFQDLVDEVMTRRMGGFQVEPKYGTALANWIDKQPAVSVKTADTAALASGKLLFESPALLCTSCHAGSALTNNQTVDVGTGGAFQVPSLRGLGLHAPYMHDGCAVTLDDRFDPACGGGDRHGKTSQLSPAQEADLIAYLQTL